MSLNLLVSLRKSKVLRFFLVLCRLSVRRVVYHLRLSFGGLREKAMANFSPIKLKGLI